jgi:hypothetical protein
MTLSMKYNGMLRYVTCFICVFYIYLFHITLKIFCGNQNLKIYHDFYEYLVNAIDTPNVGSW